MNETILVVDDDPSSIQLMARILAGVGNLRFATNGEDAVRLVRESPPDLVLLDAQMPGMSGFKVFDVLKADHAMSGVPVIFVTSHSETPFEVSALEMGAVDFIAKPVQAPLLLARVKTHLRMKQMADELRRNATTDGLTGLANRRSFDEILQREWQRSRRHGSPISLLLLDVDHFKLYNDRYGHPKGDVCLQQVARALNDTVRRTADFVARCGGEEFAILLPQTSRQGALAMAERALESVAAMGIVHEASTSHRLVSVSIGVGCYDSESEAFADPASNARLRNETNIVWSESDLVLAADKALYAAKGAGRACAKLRDIAEIDEIPQLRTAELGRR